MSKDRKDDGQKKYIVEFITIGKSVKVTAIDPDTLLEVSIVGSKKATRKQLTDVAIQKLHYMQNKKAGE